MKLLLPLFLLLALAGRSQEVLFEGHVYDARTKAPIPYANISFMNSLKGTSSNEEGYFYVDVPKDFLDKKVHISSLGYEDVIMEARAIMANKKIYTEEETYELAEVTVTQALGDMLVLNPISSYGIKSGFSSAETPWVLALYFPNVGASKKYVDKVTVYMQKDGRFKAGSSQFRLRLYAVDPETGHPGKDLVRKSIVLSSDSNEDFVSVDLAPLGIKVPKEGIYVGLEWLFLPANWYVAKREHPITKEMVSEDRFAPSFGAVYQKNTNYRTMVYGLGQWSNFSIKGKQTEAHLVPAIALKLSKEK
ncbi:carboxypeptidase-like regulatory domain-containing protein [Maribacter sp. 2307ULW6-5]|uniref:carboxypeptidase-like regulatory domain-containing protein n=1 Tax=Maribacter sp. 2307ULW6-5 TaxID=3386275 RepID=UPI0039BCC0EC